MKLKDLFAVTTGNIRWSLSELDEPMCGRDFWQKYRMSAEWEKDVYSTTIITHQDTAIILVMLKK